LGRVRETLFNWLRDDVRGSHCLDLYAGSGALGFEALSRGAATVTFVDNHPRVVRALHENAARLGAENCIVVRSTARAFLQRNGSREGPAFRPWDIIFLDPPFGGSELPHALTRILSDGLLAPGGVVYFEASRRSNVDVSGWTQIRHRTGGDSQFGLLSPDPALQGA
jgi:16S rRNA (guanine966-N2)-methyltransferase